MVAPFFSYAEVSVARRLESVKYLKQLCENILLLTSKASMISSMGVETEKKKTNKSSKTTTLDDIQEILESLMTDTDGKETTRKAAADSLITLDKYRREVGLQEGPDQPPEWFTPEFVGRVVEYMRETFAQGGLIDAEAEGFAGASFELSQEGNG